MKYLEPMVGRMIHIISFSEGYFVERNKHLLLVRINNQSLPYVHLIYSFHLDHKPGQE